MLSGMALRPAPTSTRIARRGPGAQAIGRVARLQMMLREEVARVSGVLQVAVIEGCGVIEVQVSGPAGTLRLSCDPTEVSPAFLRHMLRKRLRDYGSSLGCRPDREGQSRKEERR